MAIEWKEDFATEDPQIDTQHRQIFRFANKLEALAERDEVDQQEIGSLVHFLDNYIQSHFRYEEACMLKRHCPVAKRNRDEHIAFKTFLDSSLEAYHRDGYNQEWARRLYSKLEHWLSNHICQIDAQLRNSQ